MSGGEKLPRGRESDPEPEDESRSDSGDALGNAMPDAPPLEDYTEEPMEGEESDDSSDSG
jgi:hypothetical protein